jgi:hypothetical protein
MKKLPTDELFCGLRALEESMFPKKCAACGRVYKTLDDFLEQTQHLEGSSGLIAVKAHDEDSSIGLFRNCICHSTLLVPCKDRRGQTVNQLKRRRIFGNLLDTLEKSGWKRAQARQELLKLTRGERSEALERLIERKDPP